MTRLFRLLLLGALVLAAPHAPRGAGAQPSGPQPDGAHRGYLAARLLDGGELQVIDELNAGRLFVPASVLKVVTTAAALEHLGPDYRWRTRLTTSGAVAGGVLDGDLVVEPGADPTWGEFFDAGADEPLAALAGQVRARGVTRVAGDLVVDARRFPGRLHPLDRSFGDLPYRHGAPPAGLAVDEATITVRVAPGPAVGAPARVRAPAGVDVINRTLTVGRDRRGAGSLDFLPVWGTDTLLLRGEYPISEPSFTVPASDPAPVLRAARRLRDALHAAGVVVEGTVRLPVAALGPRPTGPPCSPSCTRPRWKSSSPEILTRSHNWYAENLDPHAGARGGRNRPLRRRRRGRRRLRGGPAGPRHARAAGAVATGRLRTVGRQPDRAGDRRARARLCGRAPVGRDVLRRAGRARRRHAQGVAAPADRSPPRPERCATPSPWRGSSARTRTLRSSSATS